MIALFRRLARIVVYSLRRTLLTESGRQLLMLSRSVVPLGRSKDLLAFTFSDTLPVVSHMVYTPARNPGPSSAFRFSLSTLIRSLPAAEPVRIAHTVFLTSLAFTASSIRSQLGLSGLACRYRFFSGMVGGSGGSVNGPGSSIDQPLGRRFRTSLRTFPQSPWG